MATPGGRVWCAQPSGRSGVGSPKRCFSSRCQCHTIRSLRHLRCEKTHNLNVRPRRIVSLLTGFTTWFETSWMPGIASRGESRLLLRDEAACTSRRLQDTPRCCRSRGSWDPSPDSRAVSVLGLVPATMHSVIFKDSMK